MRKVLRPLCVLFFLGMGVLSLFAETKEKKSPPVIPEGRVNAGKTLFVEKGCFQCHTAGDIKLPGSELDDTLLIGLGGSKDRKWTRDDFARAILNPAHTVSPEYEKGVEASGVSGFHPVARPRMRLALPESDPAASLQMDPMRMSS